MHFDKKKEIEFENVTLEVGSFETARENGRCLWIESLRYNACLDLNAFKEGRIKWIKKIGE